MLYYFWCIRIIGYTYFPIFNIRSIAAVFVWFGHVFFSCVVTWCGIRVSFCLRVLFLIDKYFYDLNRIEIFDKTLTTSAKSSKSKWKRKKPRHKPRWFVSWIQCDHIWSASLYYYLLFISYTLNFNTFFFPFFPK